MTSWHWHPSVLLGCAGLLVAYAAGTRLREPGPALAFAGGVIVLLLALVSPIHVLGDTYLFSAHMLQHLLLVQIVPPLLIVGLPAPLAEQVLRFPFAAGLESVLGRPLIAWLLGNGALWLWHLPALYNTAMAHAGIHIVEHLCFLATATIFWWPVLAPLRANRLAPLAAIFYLLAAFVASSLLGIVLTFAPPGLYPAYLRPADPLGILPLLREGWGLSPAADQHLGGILMWVPGGLVYLCAILGMLARWYGEADEQAAFDLETKTRRGEETTSLASSPLRLVGSSPQLEQRKLDEA